MSAAENIFIHGIGAVSPAGWGVLPLREALAKGEPLPIRELARPGWTRALRVRPVPPPASVPGFMSHARLRRASPITQYAAAAALEALGRDAAPVGEGSLRLGILFCAMTGCVNYSRRFYDETLKDPATASPLVFAETVFNAPASHLAALLGTTAINYTLVGDPGTFLQALAIAADWLLSERVDGCLVVGAEEMDWLTADAARLFARKFILSEGAGAVYLRPGARVWNMPETRASSTASSVVGEMSPPVRIHSITNSHMCRDRRSRARAAIRARAELPGGQPDDLLCEGTQGLRELDAGELEAWRDWPGARLAPKRILGEGLAAASAWQCVVATDALRQGQHPAATVSVVGCHQQAIGARFVISNFSIKISNP